MKVVSLRLRIPIVFFLAALSAGAQIATLDISDPTNPVVTADVNPYIYAPDLPPDPTEIYLDEFSLPSGKMITSADYIGIAYVALLDEGVLLGTAKLDFGQYLNLVPMVVTDDTAPDTYTTFPPVSSYTPPTSNPPLVSTTNSGPFSFDFGTSTSPVAPGYVGVGNQTAYSAALGYGWGDTSKVSSLYRSSVSDPLRADFCQLGTNRTPFYLDLANGHYNVSVLAGDVDTNRTIVSIRANGAPEGAINQPAGKYTQVSFPIQISDGRLRLEFIGSAAKVNAVTITRDDAPHKPTIFIAGDSTAAAYSQSLYPLTGWGDRLQNYFTTNVAVNDMAVAGTSSRSFADQGYLDVITSRMSPGDYLFICFGINDRYSDDRHTNPTNTFQAYLRLYANAARSRGGTPVFVTEQTMRTYDPYGRFYNNIGGYPWGTRQIAAEMNIPLIELNQKSIDLFTVVGPSMSRDMFMYLDPGEYPAYPDGHSDYIHFQDRGATALAKQVADAIRELKLPIAQYVLPDPIPNLRPAGRTSYQ